MADAKRPVPTENVFVHTSPFWAGAREGKLVLQFCRDSGKFQHPPRPVSIHTGGRNLEWRAVSGKGMVYARTIVRVPGPEGRLPLSVATVELEEGVRIIANILDRKPEDVKIGQHVTLAWDRLDNGVSYPAFRIVG